jgi:CheY-like chemotaxis protein
MSSGPTWFYSMWALPGMDGYQVARRMRAEAQQSNLTIIAVSGFGEKEHQSQSKQAGCDVHLVKPVHPNILRNLLGAELPIPAPM